MKRCSDGQLKTTRYVGQCSYACNFLTEKQTELYCKVNRNTINQLLNQ